MEVVAVLCGQIDCDPGSLSDHSRTRVAAAEQEVPLSHDRGVHDGGSPEHLLSTIVCTLDDAYRTRIDGTTSDAAIARLTARLTTPILEKLITSLTTAVDSSYSEGVTGAKLALIRALSVLGA